MDSMRSLNTSLPRPPRKRRSNHPPEQLIQAFKNAALSVTNLYKTAAADEVRARQAGYQDALDDILTFLDRENIGLDDGEGWRIRQWATKRLDDSPGAHIGSDSDDDKGDAARPARSASPATHQKPGRQDTEQQRQASVSSSPVRDLPNAVPVQSPTLQNEVILQAPETFTFHSSIPYPQEMETQTSGVATIDVSQSENPAQTQASPAIRVEVVPRGSRASRGANRHTSRASAARQLGSGAGSKRRIPFGDYFDIGSLGEGPAGGGKRGRFT
ncbi:MAG: hypothetical protein Q9164_000533 [Protoblastenia rupestris]